MDSTIKTLPLSNTRNRTYDYMKAFAIFLVVMDHTITLSDGIDNGFRELIYSVHMPLFFIVSGFLAAKFHQSCAEWLRFFKKKARLLIPFWVFTLGDCIILHRSFDGYLGWNKFGLWFLWTLFLFFTIYSITQVLIIKVKSKYIDIIAMLVVSGVFIVLRRYSDTAIGGVFNFLNLYNYIFFILGVVINRYSLKQYVLRDDIQFILLAIYVIGLSSGFSLLNIPMKACGILFIFGCFEKITSKPLALSGGGIVDSLICTIGKNSLHIYILHFYLIHSIKHLPEYIHSFIFMSAAFYLPLYAILSCLIIAICIIIKSVVCQNKYVRMYVFGEKK